MLIGVRAVIKARKDHYCQECQRTIHKGDPYLDMYGSAHSDPPWHLKLHPGCITNTDNPRVRAALDMFKRKKVVMTLLRVGKSKNGVVYTEANLEQIAKYCKERKKKQVKWEHDNDRKVR